MLIDIECALNALDTVIKGRETTTTTSLTYYTGPTGRSLVGEALYHLGVSDVDLTVMGVSSVQDLYESGNLPMQMTLGAMVVFRTTQRSQAETPGSTWADALDAAVRTAVRFLDLLPASVLNQHVSEVSAR